MADAILKVEALTKYFPIKKGILSSRKEKVHAVDHISFDIEKGETLGLVGESGCGKSTTGMAILRLIEPTAGEVWFEDKLVTALDKKSLRSLRKEIQIVFQDPYSSLNGRMTAGDIVGEALFIHKTAKGREKRERVAYLFETVGLPPEHAGSYFPSTKPAAFSPAIRPELIANPNVVPLRTALYVSASQPPVSIPAAYTPGIELYSLFKTSIFSFILIPPIVPRNAG